MVIQRVQKAVLFVRVVAYGFRFAFSLLGRALSAKLAALTAPTPKQPTDPSDVKNVVVVGASFAGYFAARTLATSLPRDGHYRVVVIEPSSHFNFTWVLPRFCVVEGHEHKAFIPYTPAFFSDRSKDMVRWVRDRVTAVREGRVVLRSGDEIPYEFLIIATGSTVAYGLPSRVGVDDRGDGIERLRAVQARIKAAARVVVAGGGAAGVELAADIKSRYPDKSVTLVHSRQAVMHRFGPELQKSTMDALQKLGVDVILGERVDFESSETKSVTLQSGRKIDCDCFVSAPAADLIFSVLLTGKCWAGQLHRTETGIWSDSRGRPPCHRPLRSHPCETNPPDRRRIPSQRLCMRRRCRHQGGQPECESRGTAGHSRGR
jgi:thioredoxin reductase